MVPYVYIFEYCPKSTELLRRIILSHDRAHNAVHSNSYSQSTKIVYCVVGLANKAGYFVYIALFSRQNPALQEPSRSALSYHT